MSVPSLSITLEVDPSPTEKIVITLSKTSAPPNLVVWKMSFLLQEGSPLCTVVNLNVEIDAENNAQAQATFEAGGLDNVQQGQAKIAGEIARSGEAPEDLKKYQAQQVIACRQVPQTQAAGNP
jgi:hypothetical protein